MALQVEDTPAMSSQMEKFSTRTRIEEEVDVESWESQKWKPSSGLGPKTAVMMPTEEFLWRSEIGRLNRRTRRRKKGAVKESFQGYRRPWIQVLNDTSDILIPDGRKDRDSQQILPDSYPVLMHVDDYLSEAELKAVWAAEKQRSKKSRRERMIDSLPKFIQKGQTKKLSAKKSRCLSKFVTNWGRNNSAYLKHQHEVMLGVMRHDLEWKERRHQMKRTMVEDKRNTESGVKESGRHHQWAKKDIPKLRERWLKEYEDVFQEQPERLPPKRDVTHHIPLKDPDKKYSYYRPRCPDYLKSELMEKINKYVRAGWWVPCQVNQAAPMLCIPKKNKTLRTAIDCRKRNENTHTDVTPFPDQDNIRNDVAKGKFRSKIDMTNAYEQILVHEDDIQHTAFATIYGTFYSLVMQIGDCNAPATFQRLMTSVFRDCIGRFVHVYLDDIFIFSDSIEDHEKHLRIVFDLLRKNEFYLRQDKVQLYAEQVECLGHKIDDKGIHADGDKMERIRNWRQPRNYNDVQRFLGLVQYLAPCLRDIAAYTGPLAAMENNHQPFHWRPIHDKCFAQIKEICSRTPVLKPVDPRSKEPIWVICDASITGVGAMYGQGPTWQECRPAGFMSKKFTNAQCNYRVFEQESLGILEALLKWEEKLVGYEFHVVTDHKALEFFQTQRKLSPRQTRWMEYLSRFDFDITYVKGTLNKVADALSRYYQSDTWYDTYHIDEFVNADVRLDRDMDDLPGERIEEVEGESVRLHASRVVGTLERRKSSRVLNKQETRDLEAAKIASGILFNEPEPVATEDGPELTVGTSRVRGENLRKLVFNSHGEFIVAIKEAYQKDALYKKIIAQPGEHSAFEVKDGLIWTRNRSGEHVLCVPDVQLHGRTAKGLILEQGHEVVGHYGAQKTVDYVRRWYWWPKMWETTFKFCDTCTTCQRNKSDYTKPSGKLHPLPIPTRPWQSIGMDFIGPFPESHGFNYIWVVVCRLTSMTHVIPVRTDMTASELSWIYLKEVVRLHGLPESIVSDRDPKFTSMWWKELHRVLGSKLLMSTAFHPQTDGLTERINRSIAQIIRSVISADQLDWFDKLPMVEFAINSSSSATTGFAPFEINYTAMPRLMDRIGLQKSESKGVQEFVEAAVQRLNDAYDSVIHHRVFQKVQADKRRWKEADIKVGDKVYLATKDLSLPKGRASKLLPKYIGPYLVLDAKPDTSSYRLDLSHSLKQRRIHDVFHVSKLRPSHPNDETVFPGRSEPGPYDFGVPDEETGVKEINNHQWSRNKIEFHVEWDDGDDTWESHATVKECIALDEYLALQGVQLVADLPKAESGLCARRARRSD